MSHPPSSFARRHVAWGSMSSSFIATIRSVPNSSSLVLGEGAVRPYICV